MNESTSEKNQLIKEFLEKMEISDRNEIADTFVTFGKSPISMDYFKRTIEEHKK
jgi:hypothetical protein